MENDLVPTPEDLYRVGISIGSEELSNRDEMQYWGSLNKVLKWYQWIAKYPTLKRLVDNMGFKKFLSINTRNTDNRLIHVLVERWWPSTHTFHFPYGEHGFTPLDLVMLAGLVFGKGFEIPYDDKYSMFEKHKRCYPES
ncbi:hypothetical protein GIB67_028320 [Kingdonia uniflora]|uniref:Aminotransferase-like plant mobile domain-containing protein n=1 Tax=Kingdonia uniflora TaxID=39325 RepID=A0A7J7MI71_9MAGN|nr:hypothetical protein GIB67_028320 [Kingdonia uniflora]